MIWPRPEFLYELTPLTVMIRLGLAVLFGGVIGLDRARKHRPAGLRTYMLVCMGAALVMITNEYINETSFMSDPARLGAQVISGIGFLGAGTIIVTRHHQVVGLTTAAGLWASACMGLAIGIGFYEGAVISLFFILIILVSMNSIDNIVVSKSRIMEIYVELEPTGSMSAVLAYIHDHGIKVVHIEIVKARELMHATAAIITMRLPKRHDHYEVIAGLSKIEGLQSIDEV